MALSCNTTGWIDSIYEDWLREEVESGIAMEKFWECADAVARGEMTQEIIWSDSADLSFVFRPCVS